MQSSLCERNRNFLVQFQQNDKNVLPSLRQGAACKGSAANKKASAAALPVTPSRKPRTRGEKGCTLLLQHGPGGSPPHVRGKVSASKRKPARSGITPACAGKSVSVELSDSSYEDHPRMCGENPRQPMTSRRKKGSPPHVRGKVFHVFDADKCHGITPACAGKRVCLD